VTLTHDVVDPATEELVTTVDLATVEQTDEALARSQTAFETWRRVAPADRGRLLRRFAAAGDGAGAEEGPLHVRKNGPTP
jgi:acyl-CoA reductase-like NAD-dependent aldehyde dehydrogenase